MRSRSAPLTMVLLLLIVALAAFVTTEAGAVESHIITPTVVGDTSGHGAIVLLDGPVLSLPGTGEFVWDGNSRPAGYGATTAILKPVPAVAAVLPLGWTIEGAYVGGRELSQQIIDATGVNNHPDPPWIGDCTQQVEGVDGRYDGGVAYHVVATWEFVNEQAHHGGTATSIHELLREYSLARSAAGWQVIVCTDVPRAGVPYEVLSGFNNLIRLHWREYADGVCDYAADARIGYEGAERDLTYWGSSVFPNGWDGWHMGDAGQSIAAQKMQATLAGLFPPAPRTVDGGATPVCLFSPEPGYHVAEVLVDDLPVTLTGENEYTFPPVTDDHTLSVTFAIDRHTVSVLAGENGSVTPTVAIVDYGATPSFTFVPDADHHVAEVLVDDLPVTLTAKNQYALPPVLADHTLTVAFAANTRPRLGRPRCRVAIPRGRRFSVSGSLRPRFSAGLRTVRVTAYRYDGIVWRPYRKFRAVNVDSGSASKYVTRIALARPGKYRFSAATPKTADWLATKTILSRTLSVR